MYSCAVSAYTVGSGPYSEVLNVTTAEDGTLYHHTLVFYSPFIKNILEMAKGSVIACSEYEPTYKFWLSWLRTHYYKLNAVMPELTVHTELLVYVGIYATDKGIK